MPTDNNGGVKDWNTWSMFVLKELERLNGEIVENKKLLQQTCIDLSILKVKAGVWGLIGGAIPTVVAIAFVLLK